MTKTLIILILFILAAPKLIAQNLENKLLIEEYLRQSENQRKAGITMLAVGGSAATLGLLLAATSTDWDSAGFGGGIILFVAGSATAILSIPILVSSASKARKAAQLSVGTDSARVINSQGSTLKTYPTLNLSIPLNAIRR